MVASTSRARSAAAVQSMKGPRLRGMRPRRMFSATLNPGTRLNSW